MEQSGKLNCDSLCSRSEFSRAGCRPCVDRVGHRRQRHTDTHYIERCTRTWSAIRRYVGRVYQPPTPAEVTSFCRPSRSVSPGTTTLGGGTRDDRSRYYLQVQFCGSGDMTFRRCWFIEQHRTSSGQKQWTGDNKGLVGGPQARPNQRSGSSLRSSLYLQVARCSWFHCCFPAAGPLLVADGSSDALKYERSSKIKIRASFICSVDTA